MSEVTFEPFQKVLVRYDDNCTWSINFYERKCGEQHKCLTPGRWSQCIPYEGNEHLLGSPTPPEPEFKWGDHVEVSDDCESWRNAIFLSFISGAGYPYFVLRPREVRGVEYRYCRHADW